MKVSNRTEIFNLALVRLNQNTITSDDDSQSAQAKTCRLVYESCKMDLLQQYDWSFAIKIAELQQPDTGNIKLEYLYEYSLPRDFIRVVSVFDSFKRQVIVWPGGTPPYKMEGGLLKSNYSPIYIKYIQDLNDVTLFSPGFVNALVMRLCMAMCRHFLNDNMAFSGFTQQYAFELENAKGIDYACTCQDSRIISPLLLETSNF